MQPNNLPPPIPQVPPQNSKHSHVGLILTIVVLIVLFVGTLVFAMWAYAGQQDYKQNADQKIVAAVTIAQKATSDQKDNEFREKEKSPYKTYQTKDTFGSVKVTYPKTWSAYISEDSSTTPVDGYFHPDYVPGLLSKSAYALRLEVVNQSFDVTLRQFESSAKSGKVKVSPYRAPKMPGVLGSRVDGEINPGQKDSMVLFPIRDKTLKLSTQSDTFLNDFNTIVLPNLTFVP